MSTIYRRKDGRYEGRIYFDNHRYLSFYGMSRPEVENKLSFYNSDKPFLPSELTFEKMFTEWMSFISDNIKESTACNYRMKADIHLVPFFREIRYEDISEKTIIEFIEQKRRSKLSDRYISDMITLIRSVFKFASKNHDCKNPLQGIKFSFRPSDEVKTLDSDQYTILQNTIAAESNLTSAAITLAMATGLRIGELCALQWKDIDIKKRIITVSKTIQRIRNNHPDNKTKLVVTEPKTKSSRRTIPVPECIVPVLEKYKSAADCFVVSGSIKAAEPRTLQYRFRKLLANVNLPSVHFHSLRHGFATRCLQSGMDVKTLSEILGHSRIETTLNLYVHSSFNHKTKVINKVSFGF